MATCGKRISYACDFRGHIGHCDNILAELLALLNGLILAWNEDYNSVHCWSDCMEVIHSFLNVMEVIHLVKAEFLLFYKYAWCYHSSNSNLAT